MKKLILYLCFCFIIPVGHAQVYFSNRYDHLDPDLESGMGVVADSGNYFIHFSFRSSGTPVGFGFIRLDDLGNELIDRTYFIPGYSYGSGLGNCFIKTLENKLISAGSILDSSGKINAFIVCYNYYGDTIYTRRYFNPLGNCIYYSLASTNDSGFICTGSFSDSASGINYTLTVKYDRNGDLEWDFLYPESISVSIKELYSGNFLIGGVLYGDCGAQQHSLIKISANGNFIWKKCYPAAFWEGSLHVSEQLSDGYVYLSGGKNYANGINFKPYLAKADTNGIIIWEKVFGIPGSTTGFGEVFLLSNGNLITYQVFNYYTSIYKLNPNGDSIWRKEIRYLNNPNTISAITSLALVNGDEIVGTGHASIFPADVTGKDVWVMKFDQHGCDTICWPPGPMGGLEFNVADSITSGITDQDNDYPIKAFPNPADDQLWIELPPDLLSAIVSLEIYSLDGAKKYSEKLPASHLKFPVSLSGLTNGIYFLKISDSSKTYYYKKLVVMH